MNNFFSKFRYRERKHFLNEYDRGLKEEFKEMILKYLPVFKKTDGRGKRREKS